MLLDTFYVPISFTISPSITGKIGHFCITGAVLYLHLHLNLAFYWLQINGWPIEGAKVLKGRFCFYIAQFISVMSGTVATVHVRDA